MLQPPLVLQPHPWEKGSIFQHVAAQENCLPAQPRWQTSLHCWQRVTWHEERFWYPVPQPLPVQEMNIVSHSACLSGIVMLLSLSVVMTTNCSTQRIMLLRTCSVSAVGMHTMTRAASHPVRSGAVVIRIPWGWEMNRCSFWPSVLSWYLVIIRYLPFILSVSSAIISCKDVSSCHNSSWDIQTSIKCQSWTCKTCNYEYVGETVITYYFNHHTNNKL